MNFEDFIEKTRIGKNNHVYTLILPKGKTVQDLVDYCAKKTAAELATEMSNIISDNPDRYYPYHTNFGYDIHKIQANFFVSEIKNSYEYNFYNNSLGNNEKHRILNLYEAFANASEEHYNTFLDGWRHFPEFTVKISNELEEAQDKQFRQEEFRSYVQKLKTQTSNIKHLENYISQFNNKTNYFDGNTSAHQKLYNALQRLNNGKPIEKDDIEKIKKDETFLNVDSNDIKVRINAIINVCERLHEEKTQKLIDTLLTLFHKGEDKFKEALSNEIHRDTVYGILLSYAPDSKIPNEKQQDLKNNKPFINEMRKLLPEFMQSTVEIKIFKTFAERVREEQKECEESQSRCLIF